MRYRVHMTPSFEDGSRWRCVVQQEAEGAVYGEDGFLSDLKPVYQIEEQRVRDDKVPAVAQRWAVGREAGGRRLPLFAVPRRV